MEVVVAFGGGGLGGGDCGLEEGGELAGVGEAGGGGVEGGAGHVA